MKNSENSWFGSTALENIVTCQVLVCCFILKHLAFDTLKKIYFNVFQIEKYSFETWLGIFTFPAMKMSFMSPSSYFLVQTQLAGMVWTDFALPGCQGKKLSSEVTVCHSPPCWMWFEFHGHNPKSRQPQFAPCPVQGW